MTRRRLHWRVAAALAATLICGDAAGQDTKAETAPETATETEAAPAVYAPSLDEARDAAAARKPAVEACLARKEGACLADLIFARMEAAGLSPDAIDPGDAALAASLDAFHTLVAFSPEEAAVSLSDAEGEPGPFSLFAALIGADRRRHMTRVLEVYAGPYGVDAPEGATPSDVIALYEREFDLEARPFDIEETGFRCGAPTTERPESEAARRAFCGSRVDVGWAAIWAETLRRSAPDAAALPIALGDASDSLRRVGQHDDRLLFLLAAAPIEALAPDQEEFWPVYEMSEAAQIYLAAVEVDPDER